MTLTTGNLDDSAAIVFLKPPYVHRIVGIRKRFHIETSR
jgi:hypothetical protein